MIEHADATAWLLNRPRHSWLWRNTPYTGKCFWHAIEYVWEWEWKEAWYEMHNIRSHVMWYVRAVYRPYNRLKIRNVDRRYCCDDDMYLFHAAFTVLCKHVERSHGGEAKLAKDVADRRAEQGEDGHKKAWADALETILALYRWYNGINWKDPIPFPTDGTDDEQSAWAERDFKFEHEECPAKLASLVAVHGFMWT